MAMSRSVKGGMVVAFALFLALLVYSSLQLGQVTVEVCMEYAGGAHCATAAAPTEEEAVRTATDNACALLASGRTDSMACSRTPPASVRRLD